MSSISFRLSNVFLNCTREQHVCIKLAAETNLQKGLDLLTSIQDGENVEYIFRNISYHLWQKNVDNINLLDGRKSS